MRFLCLHGMGANNKACLTKFPYQCRTALADSRSQIFEMQTAAIRYELGDHHTYEFVEGTVPCPLFPAFRAFLTPGEQYFTYFSIDSVASFQKAINDLDAYAAAEGPFDGIMGFSQGALLAASFIAGKVQRTGQGRAGVPFKCAVFFSGTGPVQYEALGRGDDSGIEYVEGEVIPIPTAHVWGAGDEIWPGRGRELSLSCKADARTVFVHDGGHDIPGARAKREVTGIVHALRRTVYKGANAPF
ncbi:hypothetical protein MMC18_009626 [Xylographa bjoerkii]|nr:hypothetical protein [Xylographa bjoerkii]